MLDIVFFDEGLVRLPIHFNTKVHSLVGEDYIIAIEAFTNSLEELNKRLFEGQLDLELRVITNEDGSIKAVTGVIFKGFKKTANFTMKTATVLGVCAALIEFTETDTFKGFVEGVSGYKIDHYNKAKELGSLGRDVAEFVHDILVGIYTMENDELERVIPNNLNLDKIIKSKSDFYTMCINNEEIRGVGFDDSERFPVKRDRFAYYTSKDLIRDVESEFIPCEVIIVSPVDTQHKAKWHVKDILNNASIKAFMEDESFKLAFLGGRYPVKQTSEDDRLTILLEYKKQEKNGVIEIKEVSIHTVYSFNDVEIKAMPTNIKDLLISRDSRPMDELW